MPIPIPEAHEEWTRVRRADGVRSVMLPTDGKRRRTAIVVERDGRAVAYINRCPHWYVPLDQGAPGFVGDDPDLLRCSVHGAEFDWSSGLCVAGACEGASLTPIQVREEGEFLVLLRPPLSSGGPA